MLCFLSLSAHSKGNATTNKYLSPEQFANTGHNSSDTCLTCFEWYIFRFCSYLFLISLSSLVASIGFHRLWFTILKQKHRNELRICVYVCDERRSWSETHTHFSSVVYWLQSIYTTIFISICIHYACSASFFLWSIIIFIFNCFAVCFRHTNHSDKHIFFITHHRYDKIYIANNV